MTGKIDQEDEYFKKQDAELKKKLREGLSEEEKEELKKLHHGHCPKCGIDLENIKKFDVELDVCPDCKGLWFDDGELERVIEMEHEDRHNIFKKIKSLFD